MPLDRQRQEAPRLLGLAPEVHGKDGTAELPRKPRRLELLWANCLVTRRHEGAHLKRSFRLTAVALQAWERVLRGQVMPQLRAGLEVNGRVFFQVCLESWEVSQKKWKFCVVSK